MRLRARWGAVRASRGLCVRYLGHLPFDRLALGLVLVDAALLWAAGQAAAEIWHRLHPQLAAQAPSWGLVGLLCLCLIGCGAMRVERMSARGQMLVRVMAGLSLGALFLAVGHMLWPAPLPPPGLHLALVVLALPVLCAARLGVLWLVDRPAFARHVVVLGSDAAYARVAGIVAQRPGWLIVGHFRAPADLGGDSAALADGLKALRVDAIIFAQDGPSAWPIGLLFQLRRRGAQLWDMASFIEQEMGRVDLHWGPSDGLVPLHIVRPALSPIEGVTQALDRLCALVLLLALSPLLALVSVAIRLDSPGPALFWQERIGQFGRPFLLVKLRSMQIGAEADGQPRWAEEEDPRITRLGRWLRQFHLDELPQLWNILRGEMRFVGPRPERPAFVRQLEAALPFYAVRHQVRPGITGWAQIHAPYAASLEAARAKLEYDLFYVKHAHFLLDAYILLQTMRVLVWRSGAR